MPAQSLSPIPTPLLSLLLLQQPSWTGFGAVMRGIQGRSASPPFSSHSGSHLEASDWRKAPGRTADAASGAVGWIQMVPVVLGVVAAVAAAVVDVVVGGGGGVGGGVGVVVAAARAGGRKPELDVCASTSPTPVPFPPPFLRVSALLWFHSPPSLDAAVQQEQPLDAFDQPRPAAAAAAAAAASGTPPPSR